MEMKMNFLIIFFSLIVYNFDTIFAFHWKYKNVKLNKNVHNVQEQWFETQRLDHFDLTNQLFWKQRYFVNATFYKPGGPIFLQIGGEGTANPIWMTQGAWISYAQKYNAACFLLEHRFYGKSHPTHNTSVDNLKYLNSRQALADLAEFIKYIMLKNQYANGTKLITFGGSYPGALSAWARLKYPHLIHGAVSSSSPVMAKLNFKEYLGVVMDSLLQYSKTCVDNIKKGTQIVQDQMKNSSGQSRLNKAFKFCALIDYGNIYDVSNFFESLAGNFMDAVQYNNDNNGFEGAKGKIITIKKLCDIMNNKSIKGDALDRLAAVNSFLLSTNNQSCFNVKYNDMIKDMQSVDWNSSANQGGRQWVWQTCTEFSYFQTSDLVASIFTNDFPLDFSVQQCMDIYGPKFNMSFIANAVDETNTYYGAKNFKATRVVFVNGEIDPWHALSITSSQGTIEYDIIYIKGTAHCANMYPAAPDDVPELTIARQEIEHLIGQWLATPEIKQKNPKIFQVL